MTNKRSRELDDRSRTDRHESHTSRCRSPCNAGSLFWCRRIQPRLLSDALLRFRNGLAWGPVYALRTTHARSTASGAPERAQNEAGRASPALKNLGGRRLFHDQVLLHLIRVLRPDAIPRGFDDQRFPLTIYFGNLLLRFSYLSM